MTQGNAPDAVNIFREASEFAGRAQRAHMSYKSLEANESLARLVEIIAENDEAFAGLSKVDLDEIAKVFCLRPDFRDLLSQKASKTFDACRKAIDGPDGIEHRMLKMYSDTPLNDPADNVLTGAGQAARRILGLPSNVRKESPERHVILCLLSLQDAQIAPLIYSGFKDTMKSFPVRSLMQLAEELPSFDDALHRDAPQCAAQIDLLRLDQEVSRNEHSGEVQGVRRHLPPLPSFEALNGRARAQRIAKEINNRHFMSMPVAAALTSEFVGLLHQFDSEISQGSDETLESFISVLYTRPEIALALSECAPHTFERCQPQVEKRIVTMRANAVGLLNKYSMGLVIARVIDTLERVNQLPEDVRKDSNELRNVYEMFRLRDADMQKVLAKTTGNRNIGTDVANIAKLLDKIEGSDTELFAISPKSARELNYVLLAIAMGKPTDLGPGLER